MEAAAWVVRTPVEDEGEPIVGWVGVPDDSVHKFIAIGGVEPETDVRSVRLVPPMINGPSSDIFQ